MLWHNFKYTLEKLFKNRALIFWTFAFPIILGTFFDMAFSDIEKNERLEVFDIAVVEKSGYEGSDYLKSAFEELSAEGENQLFNTHFTDEDEAKRMLENDEIVGVVTLQETPKVTIKSSGIDETILKKVTEEIVSTSDMINVFVTENSQNGQWTIDNYEEFIERVVAEARELIETSDPKIEDISSKNMSYTMIEFYTLIAMACLYGAVLSMTAIDDVLANMSSRGKRVAVSPTPKWALVLTSALASYVASLVGVALLFLYTIFVLKVDYGTNLPLIVVLSLVGSLAGLSIGVAAASILKADENLKTGVILAISLGGCFFSGMMGITMKYVVDTNLPILNKINPANMITDGFYSLYYYETLDRFYFDLVSLLLFSGILLFASICVLRRQKYDSI